MRVAIATVQVPFVSGGAEILSQGLYDALARAGHQAELVSMPFRFGPPASVLRSMGTWTAEDFDRFDCGHIDLVVGLKFPAFYLQHHNKRVWLLHQHRSVYELFDTPFGDRSDNLDACRLREEVMKRDKESLESASRVFTISPTVSERLLRFNGVPSEPLLHPPAYPELFESGEYMPYVFAPSRLESLKRQTLLIRALSMIQEPVFVVFAGVGGIRAQLEHLVSELGLQHRARFLGHISHAELRRWYANSMAVFFGPLQEDYGYVTLEAMLSSRAIVTCTDSGGPTHFVKDGETGYVVAPEPAQIAEAINMLWSNRARACEMGANGRQLYRALDINWDHVVDRLLAN